MIEDKSKFMKAIITASKEIITIKRLRRELLYIKGQLSLLRADITYVSLAYAELLERVLHLQEFIKARMIVLAKDIPFFPEITHFTQQEMDAGYVMIEIPFGDDKEVFDEDGELTHKFLKYVLILHNGKILPYEGEEKLHFEKIILHNAEPV